MKFIRLAYNWATIPRRTVIATTSVRINHFHRRNYLGIVGWNKQKYSVWWSVGQKIANLIKVMKRNETEQRQSGNIDISRDQKLSVGSELLSSSQLLSTFILYRIDILLSLMYRKRWRIILENVVVVWTSVHKFTRNLSFTPAFALNIFMLFH